MKVTVEELLIEARELPRVPLNAVTAYKHHMPVLIKFVDDRLCSMPEMNSLIGNNFPQVMHDNHKHHAAFMATVFSMGNYELLCKTVPWVYRSYHSHHFSYDYFPVELKAWREAIETYLDNNLNEAIRTIYDWMIDHHDQFIVLSESEMLSPMPMNGEWFTVKSSFQSSLIVGDHQKCMAIALENVKSLSDIEPFYTHIIHPVMYDVGMLWEQGVLSVAQEHLASAIVGRIMATMSMTSIRVRKQKGAVVVTASPNEFHEIGAWMIADILEIEGWEVHYLGANTPLDDLIQYLLLYEHDVLAISVTMPFNIDKAKDIIESIKKNSVLKNMKIMVGGRVFNENSTLWLTIGADGFAANIEDAKKLMHKWEKK